MKKLWLLIFACLICLTSVGCSQDSQKIDQTSEPDNFEAKAYAVDQISLPAAKLMESSAIYRTKLLYYEFANNLEFLVYDFETGETQSVGTVENMLMHGRGDTCIGGTYYTYVRVTDESGVKNVLCAIDVSDGEMKIVSENRYSNMFISMTHIDGELYALQGDTVDGVTEPFLEKINKKGRAEKIEVHRDQSDVETRLMYIAGDGEQMYALERNDYSGNDPADFRLFFSKYDSDFCRTYTTEITDIYNGKEFEGNPMSGGIGDFRVFGNYFYFIDFSGAGVLCKYDETENRAEVVFYDAALEYAKKAGDQDCEYFYIRKTNDIFKLDTKNGGFEQVCYDTDNENTSILCVRVYNDELFISKRPTDSNEYKKWESWYLVPVQNTEAELN